MITSAKYQRGTETPIECVSVAEILEVLMIEDLPAWVQTAVRKGQITIRRNAIDIIAGRYAAQAMRNDMLCFDETHDDGDQVFYLNRTQLKRFKQVAP